MRFKKVISIFTVLTMSMASVAYASGNSSAASDNKLWPLTDKKVTFRIFAQQNGVTVENIETNDFTAWYEEKTNVHIKWDLVTQGAGQQIPLMIASGDLPDAFWGNLSNEQIVTYSQVDKVFVPLDDAIDKYAPNVKKMLAESATARSYAYQPDGHIYTLLRIVDTMNEKVTKRAWVYQPWLDKLNIKLPQTTQQFYDMLVRFRDEDPNGNGKKDEIPFAGGLLNNPANNEPESYILNSFVFYDFETFLQVEEDGKTISTVVLSEEYRDGLRFMNKLYNENLLVKDTWTQDRNGLRASVEGGDVNTLGSATAMYWGHFTTENGPLGRDKEFVALPVLEGPGGVRNAFDRGQLANNGKLVVTTACKNVDLLVQWHDWFYDSEAMMLAGYNVNYGPVGKGWVKAEAGELNAAGEQAKYKLIRPAGNKQNDNWFQMPGYYESTAFLASFVNDNENRKEAFGGKETIDKYLPYSAFDKRLPYLYPPIGDSDEWAQLKTLFAHTTSGEINIYRNKFITGELSLDKDWDAYVSQLNKLGIDKYVKMHKVAYDNYLKVQASVN